MKVFLKPDEKLSRAMFRVARALERYAPSWVTVVDREFQADLIVRHVIGLESIFIDDPRPFVAVQYCTGTTESEGDYRQWLPLWRKAQMVWSYLDLRPQMPAETPFYLAPLGLDPAFVATRLPVPRNIVMTSGYVAGPGAEAIEEFACAAQVVGLQTIHIGPPPEDIRGALPPTFQNFFGVPDIRLANFYRNALWVCGLRYVEGFEMPAMEGLACGARPVVFDRPDMRRWYNGHATFVPECSGAELVDHLVSVFAHPPRPVTDVERETVLARFSWHSIVEGFWQRLKDSRVGSSSYCDVGADVTGGGAS